MIAKSKYTTKLAALVNEFPDVVELLNGTAANYTGKHVLNGLGPTWYSLHVARDSSTCFVFF